METENENHSANESQKFDKEKLPVSVLSCQWVKPVLHERNFSCWQLALATAH